MTHNADIDAPLKCRLLGHRFWIGMRGGLTRLCVRCGAARATRPRATEDDGGLFDLLDEGGAA